MTTTRCLGWWRWTNGAASERRISGTLQPTMSLPLLVPLCGQRAGDDEPGVGGHGQGDVGIPGPPVAVPVLILAGLTFGLLEAFLDGSAGPGEPAISSSTRTGPCRW